MNKINLHIHGFKCFADNCFELNKLTLLTGANASGKSSIIQALLLLKVASESKDALSIVDLVDPRYAFDFGTPDSLINNELKEDEVTISLADDVAMAFNGGKQGQDRKLLVGINNLEGLQKIFSQGMTYFSAERQGPRYEYVRIKSDGSGCGCHGENTGNVISDNWNTRINGSRLLLPTEGEAFFNIALDDWLSYIFPGIAIQIQPVGSQNYQVFVKDNTHNVRTNSTNIGFGISYALPILAGALLAHEGGWVILENPEAHLHAKAQSNMGYFLGMMAAAGLRIVVETHSEHVVNGVRRAAIVSGRVQPNDVNIYFFKGKKEATLISIDEQGNLSDFPVDFFDQTRQDMMEIIKKVRNQ